MFVTTILKIVILILLNEKFWVFFFLDDNECKIVD